MLTSTVIEIDGQTSGAEPVPGHLVHAWLLKSVVLPRDPALAEVLHSDHAGKPFTVSSLGWRPDDRGGAVGEVRVTAFTPRLVSVIDSLTPDAIALTNIGRTRLRVRAIHREPGSHPYAWRETWGGLVERAGAIPSGVGVSLTFTSPTAFASSLQNMAALFPLPQLVFRRLALVWNAHAPASMEVDEAQVERLIAGLYIDQYDLQTRTARLRHQTTRGFTGRCDYRCEASLPLELQQLAHRLATLALFAGVGMRTTQGLGQTIAAPIQTKRARATRALRTRRLYQGAV